MVDSKVVLIAGSSSGIGQGAAFLFAKNGFRVVVHGSQKDKVDFTVAECNKLVPIDEHKAIGIVADFKDPNNAEILVEKTIKQFGRIDALICSVGNFRPTDFNSTNCFNEFRTNQIINVDSQTLLIAAAAPYLLKSQNASITIISIVNDLSIRGHLLNYLNISAKLALAKSISIDLAPKVRINTVNVGSIYTPEWEKFNLKKENFHNNVLLQRCGDWDEVSGSIWHISQEATYCTGSELTIDGGLYYEN